MLSQRENADSIPALKYYLRMISSLQKNALVWKALIGALWKTGLGNAANAQYVKPGELRLLYFGATIEIARRGFHNTYVFYQLFKDVLEGRAVAFLNNNGQQLDLPFSER